MEAHVEWGLDNATATARRYVQACRGRRLRVPPAQVQAHRCGPSCAWVSCRDHFFCRESSRLHCCGSACCSYVVDIRRANALVCVMTGRKIEEGTEAAWDRLSGNAVSSMTKAPTKHDVEYEAQRRMRGLANVRVGGCGSGSGSGTSAANANAGGMSPAAATTAAAACATKTATATTAAAAAKRTRLARPVTHAPLSDEERRIHRVRQPRVSRVGNEACARLAMTSVQERLREITALCLSRPLCAEARDDAFHVTYSLWVIYMKRDASAMGQDVFSHCTVAVSEMFGRQTVSAADRDGVMRFLYPRLGTGFVLPRSQTPATKAVNKALTKGMKLMMGPLQFMGDVDFRQHFRTVRAAAERSAARGGCPYEGGAPSPASSAGASSGTAVQYP